VPWVVKVVARVRRPGPTGTPAAVEAVLTAAEAALTVDCRTALASREVMADFRWHMRAFPQADNQIEVYPKCEVVLPMHEADPRPADPSAIYEKLRLCRDAIVARLEVLAAAQNWTIILMHKKSYGD